MTTTITRAKYFPATIYDPAQKLIRWQRVYVVLGYGGDHAGLWCYDKPDSVAFNADIDWSETKIPPHPPRTGMDIYLADGTLFVLTSGTPCACGALGRWSGPGWSFVTEARSA